MKQALDFLEDSRQLFNLLKDKKDEDFKIATQFKNWTINDVIGHLHIFNFAANLSLKSNHEFDEFFFPIRVALKEGNSLLDPQNLWLKGLSGRDLLEAWWLEVQKVSKNFAIIDPKLRLNWAGPDMSARSSITARQMETWAHGQEIFDILGRKRVESDRIKNIAHLGILTFAWSFSNRKLMVPLTAPFVNLKSPSGDIWKWNDPSSRSKIEGSAVDFVSVVTQTRNILDTSLKVKGDEAVKWMSIAQCFAGPPNDPPKQKTRYFKR